jgi:hypothetical protein
VLKQLYRLHDSNEELKRKGAIPVASRDEAVEWNREGWGIFATVNDFNGPRRIQNLTQINAWALDLDAGTKASMLERIRKGPLLPSQVVETKRGYQVYFRAKDAMAGHWNAIVLDLRVPDFWHMKDPKDPFLVRKVFEIDVSYSESQVAHRFEDVGSRLRAEKERREAKRQHREPSGDNFWDAVFNLDCEEALRRLIGHPAVGGEQYTFRRVGNGNLNILVDGKTTSCWIDRNGRIGSLHDGGPTIAQWLRYFRLSYGEAAKVIKQLYPQLERCK